MTAKLNPFAAAPALMKSWMTVSVAAAGSLEPTLIELVKIRAARPSSASICWLRGARRPATPIANAPRSAGPMR